MSVGVVLRIRPLRVPQLANAPHAMPYQGSKRRLAHAIVRLIPDDILTLHEPFAGSAAITIATRHVRLTESAQISDINEPLIALWQEILYRPSELADEYEWLWHAQLADPRTYYDEIRAKFNETHEPRLLLYLLARCVKAAVRYNKKGEFNQGADHRRLGVRPARMRTRLIGTSQTLHGTTARTVDYGDALRTADPRDVVYMDPPYEGVSNTRDHRYVRGLDKASFEAALADAIRDDVSFIVSYDGASGDHSYGGPLSPELRLLHLHLYAGRSSQATLQGLAKDTLESLYLSPALLDRLGGATEVHNRLGGATHNAN
jgi:DNA adenine methylase